MLNLQSAERENKACLDKLRHYKPSYRPYSFLQRERTAVAED